MLREESQRKQGAEAPTMDVQGGGEAIRGEAPGDLGERERRGVVREDQREGGAGTYQRQCSSQASADGGGRD